MGKDGFSADVKKLSSRILAAQKAADSDNLAALEKALIEINNDAAKLLKDIQLDERGNQATRIQNTDV
jgi:hypothetical protein